MSEIRCPGTPPLGKIQFVLRFLFLLLPALPLFAQDNYEIQVYGVETV
jgi:hypothetical protein